jgi:hypothetical protein
MKAPHQLRKNEKMDWKKFTDECREGRAAQNGGGSRWLVAGSKIGEPRAVIPTAGARKPTNHQPPASAAYQQMPSYCAAT